MERAKPIKTIMCKWMVLFTAWLLVAGNPDRGATAADNADKSVLATPSAQQYVFHEQERIAMVSLDPCTWQGRDYDNHSTPLAQINPAKLDTDQWCQSALAWGAKEMLFVAKHTGGFCWWQTQTTDYSVKSTPWHGGKGDVLVDLAKSCRKYGLNIGIYVYPGDESWGAAIGSGGRTSDPAKQKTYNKVFRQQMRETIEIASRYAPVAEVWFDGSCVIEVGDILKQFASKAAVFQGPYASVGWAGNEDGYVAYPKWNTISKRDLWGPTAAAGDTWVVWEADTPLYGPYWFWSAQKEKIRKSLDQLMNVYYKSVGRGAVMMLNSTPNTDGLIPAGDMQRYRELGAEIERRFGRPLAQTSGRSKTLEIDLGKPALVNHAMIMEDYWFGERIRSYVVEGFCDAQWKQLAQGTLVGRKRIEYFNTTSVSKVRLRITQAADNPLIRQFAVFHVTNYRIEPDQPQSDWAQCAVWKDADFKEGKARLEINLTPYIPTPGQYDVKFLKMTGPHEVNIVDEVLLQSGQPSAPGMLTRVNEPLTFIVTRTAVISKEADIRLKCSLQGANGEGVVLIRPGRR